MKAKYIINKVYANKHIIPSREEVIDFAESKGLEIFDKGENAFMSSDKISLILNLDINNPESILEYLIDDGEGNTYKMNNIQTKIKSRIKGFIDMESIDESMNNNIGEIKIIVTSNSVYDDVKAIIDGKEVNITDWDVV